MSYVMDYFTINNSVNIEEMQRQQHIQMRLAEFRERTDKLAQATGVNALGFFGFEKENPTLRQQQSWGTKLFFTVLGAAVAGLVFGPAGLAFGTLAAVTGIGAAVGLMLGYLPESETSRLERAVMRYDGYLTRTEEVAMARGRAVAPAGVGAERSVGHAQTILAEREQSAAAERSV